MKKITTVLVALIVGMGLTGCSTGADLPEGDVKIIQQNFNGIVDSLLTSATNHEMTSSLASMVLPTNAQYEISLIAEEYEFGELVSEETILTHLTGTLTNDSILHFIMHAGHGERESMFAIAEADLESDDMSNPNYIMTSASYRPIFTMNGRFASHIERFGGDLDDELILAVFISSDLEDNGVNVFNIEEYSDRSIMAELERAVLIRAEITQK